MLILYIAAGIPSLHFSVTTEYPRLSNWYTCTDMDIVYNLPHFVVEPWYIRTLRRCWRTHLRKNCTTMFVFYKCPYEVCASLLSVVTCFGLQFEVLFCRHEQCMRMTQISQLYLKESLKIMKTLGRLSYCIALLVYSRTFWKNSVRIVWSTELFDVLHQFHPHWHGGPIPAFWAPSFWSCQLQWLPEIRMTSNWASASTNPSRHMTVVFMVAVGSDAAFCCCWVGVIWRHVMCCANYILKKVGGKPLETLFATNTMVRRWHPCEKRKGE